MLSKKARAQFMADIPIINPDVDGFAAVDFVPTTPAGDAINWDGSSIVVEFRNGHSSGISVTFPAFLDVVRVDGAGIVPVPDRSYTIPAGQEAAFFFENDFTSAYVDEDMKLPIVYGSGNANLLIRALGLTQDTSGGGFYIDDLDFPIGSYTDDLGQSLSMYVDDLGRRL